VNIAFIGNPASVHDLKWAAYFADKQGNNVFFIPSSQSLKNKKSFPDYEGIDKIIFLEALPGFSILKFFKTIKGRNILKKIVKENRIEIVHISFAAPNALWGLCLPVKYIVATHGSDILKVIPSLLRTKGLRGIHDRMLWRLFRKAFRKAAAVTCASSYLSDNVRGISGLSDNVFIVRSGIDVEAFQSTPLVNINDIIAGKKLIFSPRFVNEVYDTVFQVDAISMLSDEILRNYVFAFIRPTPSTYSELVESKLSEIKITRPLEYIFLKMMSPQEMLNFYKNASLVLMTPLSDGTPSSALEAMAAKKPLITSDLNYDKELFTDTCLRIKVRSPEYLAGLITYALTDYPGEMIEKAYIAVLANGNRNIEMEKLNDIYKRVIG